MRSNAAHSNSTSVRALGDFGLLAAHDAGQAGGAAARRQMTSIVVRPARAPCRPAWSASRRAGRGAPRSCRPRTLLRSKACIGMAGLDHDEVGDIHDVVDGAHARAVAGTRAATWATGRCCTLLDDARAVARAQVSSSCTRTFTLVMDMRPAPASLHRRFRAHDTVSVQHGGASRAPCPMTLRQSGTVGQNLKVHRRRRPGRRLPSRRVPRA